MTPDDLTCGQPVNKYKVIIAWQISFFVQTPYLHTFVDFELYNPLNSKINYIQNLTMTTTSKMMTTTTQTTTMPKIINLCSIKCDTLLELQDQRDLESDDDNDKFLKTTQMTMTMTTSTMTKIINLCSIKFDTLLESQYQGNFESDNDDDDNNNKNDKNHKSLQYQEQS